MRALRSLAAWALLTWIAAGCGGSTGGTTTAVAISSITESTSTTIPPEPPSYGLGNFPPFPEAAFDAATTDELQGVLDTAIADGTFVGVTATVIHADWGSWSGVAGSWDGTPVTRDGRYPTHSSAKTIVAAQVLALAEQGRIDLDDLASDHLPPGLAFFDANGASIRQVLGMRSGIPDLNEASGYYPAEQADDAVEVFMMLPEPSSPPGSGPSYASTNYVLLGVIIETVTGRTLSDALHTGVLDRAGLEGIRHTVGNSLASDGWGVETTSAGLARWGYELYGGFVISPASLDAMTEFQGEWYGLGVMDLSGEFGTYAVGHQGLSSVTTCCSAITLVALPEEGIVVAVQANTVGSAAYVDTNRLVDQLAAALSEAVQG